MSFVDQSRRVITGARKKLRRQRACHRPSLAQRLTIEHRDSGACGGK
jgi:hypothetical protein